MNTKKLQRFALFILFCGLCSLVWQMVKVSAQEDFRVTGAVLKADDGRPNGKCPVLVKFNGSITANGAGTVKYTFTRSDGATTNDYSLVFEKAGTKPVSTDWTLGDTSVLPRYEGWQAVKILAPNEMESSQETGSFILNCAGAPPKGKTSGEAAENIKSPPDGKDISPVVMDALRRSEKDAAARADARKVALEAERRRYEPATNALVDALKNSGVDLTDYLTASRQFVETPREKTNQSTVDAVNRKYAEPIRNAIAKIAGSPAVGGILQGQQGSGDLGGSSPVGNVASCCSIDRFEPPFEGLFTEGDLGARAIRGGETRQLEAQVRSAVASAPHNLKRSGRRFTVPADARHVAVTVHLGTNWVIGLSGVGYAHVWLGLDMDVSVPGGMAVCSAPHLEQDNQSTWSGGSLMLSDHRPGPAITRTCRFDRNPGDPTEYAANVSASTDGTFFGFSGGYGDYYVDLGTVEVNTCP